MAVNVWGAETAETYDSSSSEMFAPGTLDPAVDFLVRLAGDGRALEFAIGTGRVALPLSARGVTVKGIELSPDMIEQLRAKPGSDAIEVTIGDMTDTRVPGSFSLVYLVWNTIMNVTTQDEQLAIFANAAAHLNPGGHFVVEVLVPEPRAARPGDLARVFAIDDDHIGLDTYDDLIGQISSSHHWREVDGKLIKHSAAYRYVWPSELVLMGKLAGLELVERWAGFASEPFTEQSTKQIAVFGKPH